MEQWKAVKNYEGLYEVSNLGRIRSLVYRYYSGRLYPRNKILKPFNTKRGYLHIELKKDKVGITFKVHRLVLSAFTEEHEDLQVNHINGIKTDNRLENLEWVTNSENQVHAYKLGLHKRNSRPVEMFSLQGVFLKRFDSILEASKEMNVSGSRISNSCKHHEYLSGTYRWRYVGDDTDMTKVYRKHGVNYEASSNKITRAQADEIRQLISDGVTGKDIALRYGISAQTVCDIKHNRIWKKTTKTI